MHFFDKMLFDVQVKQANIIKCKLNKLNWKRLKGDLREVHTSSKLTYNLYGSLEVAVEK